jgi:hypothetical protein
MPSLPRYKRGFQNTNKKLHIVCGERTPARGSGEVKKTGMDNAGAHPCLSLFPRFWLGGYLWELRPSQLLFFAWPRPDLPIRAEIFVCIACNQP